MSYRDLHHFLHISTDSEGSLSKQPTQREREHLGFRLVPRFRQIFRDVSNAFPEFSDRLHIDKTVS